MNFPKKLGQQNINQNNWVTADEYGRLKKELLISIERCKKADQFLDTKIKKTSSLVEDIIYNNGMEFLKKNFI
ncbi:MAG: hypothetical protein M3352_06160 [Bacteroidota bacterium]|nr:hypothetical protein [Bacteroidota bacterium]